MELTKDVKINLPLLLTSLFKLDTKQKLSVKALWFHINLIAVIDKLASDSKSYSKTKLKNDVSMWKNTQNGEIILNCLKSIEKKFKK